VFVIKHDPLEVPQKILVGIVGVGTAAIGAQKTLGDEVLFEPSIPTGERAALGRGLGIDNLSVRDETVRARVWRHLRAFGQGGAGGDGG